MATSEEYEAGKTPTRACRGAGDPDLPQLHRLILALAEKLYIVAQHLATLSERKEMRTQ